MLVQDAHTSTRLDHTTRIYSGFSDPPVSRPRGSREFSLFELMQHGHANRSWRRSPLSRPLSEGSPLFALHLAVSVGRLSLPLPPLARAGVSVCSVLLCDESVIIGGHLLSNLGGPARLPGRGRGGRRARPRRGRRAGAVRARWPDDGGRGRHPQVAGRSVARPLLCPHRVTYRRSRGEKEEK